MDRWWRNGRGKEGVIIWILGRAVIVVVDTENGQNGHRDSWRQLNELNRSRSVGRGHNLGGLARWLGHIMKSSRQQTAGYVTRASPPSIDDLCLRSWHDITLQYDLLSPVTASLRSSDGRHYVGLLLAGGLVSAPTLLASIEYTALNLHEILLRSLRRIGFLERFDDFLCHRSLPFFPVQ